MSSESCIPKYLEDEATCEDRHKELLSSLPKQPYWCSTYMCQYQGFWYLQRHTPGVISSQKHFQPQPSDIFLVTTPKSGTTWIKAMAFALLYRKHHPPLSPTHPLLTHNPHHLVPNLEIDLFPHSTSNRLLSSHLPYASLPNSIKTSSSSKLVYPVRNPKDSDVSHWHYVTRLRPKDTGDFSFEEVFGMFCQGFSPYGAYWDHVLGYWSRAKEDPGRVLFIKYEDLKEQPAVHLLRLAEFLDCPLSEDEVQSDIVEHILELTSFDNMKRLEVNKNGKLPNGVSNSAFFRKGEIGDWKNHLSSEMAQRIDQITQQRFYGSGLLM